MSRKPGKYDNARPRGGKTECKKYRFESSIRKETEGNTKTVGTGLSSRLLADDQRKEGREGQGKRSNKVARDDVKERGRCMRTLDNETKKGNTGRYGLKKQRV